MRGPPVLRWRLSSFQEVRGWVDLHIQMQTHEFLGGLVILGSWRCRRHGAQPARRRRRSPLTTVFADGGGAWLERLGLGDKRPGNGHDPFDRPRASDPPRPAPARRTKEAAQPTGVGSASWRAGLSTQISLLTENHVLWTRPTWPALEELVRRPPRLRAPPGRGDARDAGLHSTRSTSGIGFGWNRIVTDPFEARKVINQRKLAVVMGMKNCSAPSGRNVQLGRPTCTDKQMLAQLAEMKRLGADQEEMPSSPTSSTTPSPAWPAWPPGTTGTLTNSANFLSTGSFLRMQSVPRRLLPPAPRTGSSRRTWATSTACGVAAAV